MSHISTIQWWPYRLPYRHHLTTAHGSMAAREGAIVELETDTGIGGLGEIAPLPAFDGATLPACLDALAQLVPQICGLALPGALALLQTWQETAEAIPASTLCGLESALLDARARELHCSISVLLNPAVQPRVSIPVNAVIGADTPDRVAMQAREAVAAGLHCVKLKMGRESVTEAVERVAAVRAAIGPSAHLRLDANAGWTFAEAHAILTHCAAYDIQYVEQPLAAGNLAGMRLLRKSVSVPLAADEAVCNPVSARHVLVEEAAEILVLKPQLTGGLLPARRIVQEAAQQGVQCVVTSAMEAGVGVAGALHLAAASPEITLECGLATLPLLLDDLLLDDLPVQNGCLSVPAGPGLGVQLRR